MNGDKGEKHRFYEAHREEIVADLRATGRQATCKKWNIASSTMTQLGDRWLTREERKELTTRGNKAAQAAIKQQLEQAAKEKATRNGLPLFPEFSNDWDKAVQMRWLEVYLQLSQPV